jgi:hypothetical protein
MKPCAAASMTKKSVITAADLKGQSPKLWTSVAAAAARI